MNGVYIINFIKLARRPGLPVLLSAGFWVLVGGLSSRAATTNVNIQGFAFSPSSVTINVNDAVTWKNLDSVSHTSTSDTGLWDSGTLNLNGTFTHTFTAAGSYPYHCFFHSFMHGSVVVQAAANVPPTVTITNPANGALFSAPAAFTLAATASDSDGTVTNVQFLQGTTSLGNVAHSPYSVAVSSLAAGTYTFSAVATDNGGLKATNSITIMVNALPVVTMTHPTNGTLLAAPATLTLQATATDSDDTIAQVRFLQGAASLGIASGVGSQYSLTLSNLAAGPYAFSAVATDSRGGSSTSAPVNVSVVTPVSITLGSPTRLSATDIQFDYTANVGLSYMVLKAGVLTNFSPIITNTAASNPVTFVDHNAVGLANFYRVILAPNP